MNANLDFTIDQYMMTKIEENPLVQPLLMDAPTLVSATSKVSSEEELDDHMN